MADEFKYGSWYDGNSISLTTILYVFGLSVKYNIRIISAVLYCFGIVRTLARTTALPEDNNVLIWHITCVDADYRQFWFYMLGEICFFLAIICFIYNFLLKKIFIFLKLSAIPKHTTTWLDIRTKVICRELLCIMFLTPLASFEMVKIMCRIWNPSTFDGSPSQNS